MYLRDLWILVSGIGQKQSYGYCVKRVQTKTPTFSPLKKGRWLVLPNGMALDTQGLGVSLFLFDVVFGRKDRLILI